MDSTAIDGSAEPSRLTWHGRPQAVGKKLEDGMACDRIQSGRMQCRTIRSEGERWNSKMQVDGKWVIPETQTAFILIRSKQKSTMPFYAWYGSSWLVSSFSSMIKMLFATSIQFLSSGVGMKQKEAVITIVRGFTAQVCAFRQSQGLNSHAHPQD